MRYLISLLILVNPCLSFADYRRPAFWNDEWQDAYDEFSHHLSDAFTEARGNRDTEIALRNVGEALAHLNVLAQKPCRVNPTYCRVELEYLIRDAALTARGEWRPTDEEGIERQYALLTDLRSLTSHQLLQSHAVNLRKAWEKSADSEALGIAQGMVPLFSGLLLGGSVAYFLDQGWIGIVASSAAGFIAGAVAFVTWLDSTPYYPLTSRFDLTHAAVEAPMQTCVNRLTSELAVPESQIELQGL